MFLVKVAYDGNNQQFRLVDQNFSGMFEDGQLYLMVADFLPEELHSEGQFIDMNQAEMGHA